MAEKLSERRLCVFGYGSLIWKPNFTFKKREVGYIKGYQRRLYHGTTKHRGTPDNPGRVATLVPCQEDFRVWGCAYELVGEEEINAALNHLNEREFGYSQKHLDFYPISCDTNLVQDNSGTPTTYKVLTYISGPESEFYLGDAPLEIQSAQITSAHGDCGANSEYAQMLVKFMTTEIPNELGRLDDPYIFELERLIREQMSGRINTHTAIRTI